MNKLLVLFLVLAVSGSCFGQGEKQEIAEAGLTFSLPNDKWVLTEMDKCKKARYVYKRESIIDKNGEEVVPTIVLTVEKAGLFVTDVEYYAIDKQLEITPYGVDVDSILMKDGNKNYPLSVDNSRFFKCRYKSDSQEHIFYMIFIITTNKKAINLFMDMNSSVADRCEKEFYTVIQSINTQ